ncbi:MAG: DMT family transporter [Lachnospiraceae bacterium]|nr:DMT family transporter [Candidatus Equihabitans merdae]
MLIVGALICTTLWGSAYPSIKTGYLLFDIPAADSAAQILFAGCRFTLAGIMAMIAGSFIQRKVLIPKKASLPKIGLLCLLQTVVQYVFFYISLAHMTGVKSSILSSISVFFSLIFAVYIFRQEKMTMNKLLATIVGFTGIIIVNLGGDFSLDFHLLGEGFMILSSISYTFSTIFLKIFSKDEDPVILSGCQFIVGGIIMIIIGLLMGGHFGQVTPSGLCLLLYMAFISAAAYSLWGILLKYHPVTKVTIFTFTTPIFGVILSGIILGEYDQIMKIQNLIALVMVCCGIYLMNHVGTKKAAA